MLRKEEYLERARGDKGTVLYEDQSHKDLK